MVFKCNDVLIINCIITSAVSSQSANWHVDTVTGRQYLIITDYKPYGEAEDICTSYGAKLIKVNQPEVLTFITPHL